EVSDRGTSAMSQDAVSRAVAQLPGAAPSRAVPDPPPELFGQPTPGASPSGSAGRHHGAPSASASAAPGDAHATTPASRTAAPQQTPRQPPASPAPTRPPATG